MQPSKRGCESNRQEKRKNSEKGTSADGRAVKVDVVRGAGSPGLRSSTGKSLGSGLGSTRDAASVTIANQLIPVLIGSVRLVGGSAWGSWRPPQ